MSKQHTPFRFETVGSFLRPDYLKKARLDFENGKITKEELTAVEDKAILDLVAKQKKAGIKAITDGEFRRATWHLDFMWGFNGVEHKKTENGVTFHGEQALIDDTWLSGEISVDSHPFVEHYKFVKALEDENTVAKQTTPAPAQFFQQFIIPANIETTRKFYSTDEELINDIANGYKKVIKDLYDAGETEAYELWSDDWKKGFYPEGKVFCYFGPAWLVNFSMAADTEGSIGYNGGWGAAEGPQGFYWGGTWICAANGTDNKGLIKDIILKMTTDADIMKDIVVDDDDFVNNSTVMNGLADGTIMGKDNKPYESKILGGQNPLEMYCAGVADLDLSNICAYDQGCNEEFQNAMKNYFEGKATKDEALDLFYKAVTEKYPELTY